MNKVVAWESAVSWGISALNHQIQRLDEHQISSAYDRARRADLLELQDFFSQCLKDWRNGNLEYIVSVKTTGANQ